MAVSKQHSLVGLIMNSNDPFEILGVAKNCSEDDIDRCYKWTIAQVHPDKNSHPLATKAAQKVNVSRDLLLCKPMQMNQEPNTEISEIYYDIIEELSKILVNLKAVLYIIPPLILFWLFRLYNYATASEWSLVQTSLHSIQRKTNFYRINYYTLSETCPEPPEYQVLQEYLSSLYHSFKEHCTKESWFTFLFSFPKDDLCTEAKMVILNAFLLLTFVTITFNYFRRSIAILLNE